MKWFNKFIRPIVEFFLEHDVRKKMENETLFARA